MNNFKVDYNISIEDAHLMFKNFVGEASKFNRAGDRNFCVEIDPAEAPRLQDDGWNIKVLKPRDDDEEPIFYLQCKLKYGGFKDPEVYMVSKGKPGKTLLDEDTIGLLQHADICNVDLIIRPYNYDINGKTGVTAYVNKMYVTVELDEFASKYD